MGQWTEMSPQAVAALLEPRQGRGVLQMPQPDAWPEHEGTHLVQLRDLPLESMTLQYPLYSYLIELELARWQGPDFTMTLYIERESAQRDLALLTSYFRRVRQQLETETQLFFAISDPVPSFRDDMIASIEAGRVDPLLQTLWGTRSDRLMPPPHRDERRRFYRLSTEEGKRAKEQPADRWVLLPAGQLLSLAAWSDWPLLRARLPDEALGLDEQILIAEAVELEDGETMCRSVLLMRA